MPRFSFLLRLPVVIFLAHVYVGVRLLSVVSGLAWCGLGAGALALVFLLILAGFSMRRAVGRQWGDMVAWAGFLALGLFSWLFVLTVLRDVILSCWALWAVATDIVPPTELLWVSAAVVPVLALLACVWGLFNARRRARVKRVDVPLTDLPEALHGFSIVQISDIHVGPTIKRGYVDAIVEKVNALLPDLVAITGDIVDGSVLELADHTRPLGQLRAAYGVYAVTGNHEYYSGAGQWVDELRRLGLRVLLNEHVVLDVGASRLAVAGVTDFGAAAFDALQASDPGRALAGAPDDAVKLLLAHQPRSVYAAESEGYHLQLSGHTHGGQFLPWNFLVRLQQPFTAGLHRYGRMLVYVSRGTGYWGPPMRLGASSEITHIRLVRAE